MWHASVMSRGALGWEQRLALEALKGVGDASLGEWREHHKAFHIRRRLSDAEIAASGLAMRDLRNTVEGKMRLHKLASQFPHLSEFAMDELGLTAHLSRAG